MGGTLDKHSNSNESTKNEKKIFSVNNSIDCKNRNAFGYKEC